MSVPSTNVVPPGWYPDPGGLRQWRVWTGTDWSDLTRPYGDAVTPRPSPPHSLMLALRRVQSVGIIGVIGGLGLLVSVLVHWPGTTHPEPQWFADVASNVAVALLAVGATTCAFGVRELEGRWSLAAILPGLNLFYASALVNRRLGLRPNWRIVSEVVLLVAFVISARQDLWFAIAPAIVAYLELTWFSALIDRLGVGARVNSAVAPSR
ncbi:MAG: hypothetical protein WA359_04825 [Acidimicrobiales bacterium]